MYYFGIIFEMKFQYVRKRAEFLKQFLDLPSLDQMCGTLRLANLKLLNSKFEIQCNIVKVSRMHL